MDEHDAGALCGGADRRAPRFEALLVDGARPAGVLKSDRQLRMMVEYVEYVESRCIAVTSYAPAMRRAPWRVCATPCPGCSAPARPDEESPRAHRRCPAGPSDTSASWIKSPHPHHGRFDPDTQKTLSKYSLPAETRPCRPLRTTFPQRTHDSWCTDSQRTHRASSECNRLHHCPDGRPPDMGNLVSR